MNWFDEFWALQISEEITKVVSKSSAWKRRHGCKWSAKKRCPILYEEFAKSGRQELNLRPLRPERNGVAKHLPLFTGQSPAVGDGCPDGCPSEPDFDARMSDLATELRGQLTAEQLETLVDLLTRRDTPNGANEKL